MNLTRSTLTAIALSVITPTAVWPPEMADATTAYKLIGDNWYLFVVRH
jgi:hypothetical protein